MRRALRALLLAFLASAAFASHAADDKAAPPERYAPATLTIFNRPVFTFRHAILGVPPEERELIFDRFSRGAGSNRANSQSSTVSSASSCSSSSCAGRADAQRTIALSSRASSAIHER